MSLFSQFDHFVVVAQTVVGACVGVAVVNIPGALLGVSPLCRYGPKVTVVFNPGPFVVLSVCSPGRAVGEWPGVMGGVKVDAPAKITEIDSNNI